MSKRRLPPPAAIGFLMPNFLGLLLFVLLPVVFSLVMAFTNWSLKPAVRLEWLRLRNFHDLLGYEARQSGDGALSALYLGSIACVAAGLITALWAAFRQWRGARWSGAIFAAVGAATMLHAIVRGGPGAFIVGIVAVLCGLAMLARQESNWRLGIGMAPGVLLAIGSVGLVLFHGRMWQAYELRDPRFWQYFYNTAFLMAGIPLGIAGSLGLALLLNDPLPLGTRRRRLVSGGLLLLTGVVMSGLVLTFGRGGSLTNDLALLTLVFWTIAALGAAFNVVSFRTLFYLPSFTAGVALMVLWKALYNPRTGPINAVLASAFSSLGLDAAPPEWLSDATWAKPALMIMGMWIAIGGTNMLLYLAALSGVPKDLLEAAEVDGAGRWARFRHVTWPQLAPTTFFISVMSVIGGLQGGFEQARVMTNGGPAGATTTLSFYIFNKAFQDLDLGYAAAISWVLFSIIFVATALNWKFGKGSEVDL